MTDPKAETRADSQAFWNLLDESVLGRIVTWVTAPWADAYEHSLAASVSRAFAGLSATGRLRLIGVTAAVSASVHVALIWSQVTAGWWWTLIPAMAFVFGISVILITTASSQR